jgi:hypothetical protein
VHGHAFSRRGVEHANRLEWIGTGRKRGQCDCALSCFVS